MKNGLRESGTIGGGFKPWHKESASVERVLLAAFRQQEAARLALLPSFSLALDGGHLTNQLLSLLRLNPWLLHGALGVSVPIYTGGRLQAQVQIATAEQSQAVARYGSVALRAFYEVEVALTSENLLAQRLQIEQQGHADHTEAVRIARLRYVAGSMDMLSVLQLQERQINSQAAVIELRNAAPRPGWQLRFRAGGGSSAHDGLDR
jgi:multidrug efflux system outer membrane protein